MSATPTTSIADLRAQILANANFTRRNTDRIMKIVVAVDDGGQYTAPKYTAILICDGVGAEFPDDKRYEGLVKTGEHFTVEKALGELLILLAREVAAMVPV